jgi:hypothetical protein
MQHWAWAGLVCIASCFCVFYLPFLLPPAPFPGVSASNAAGFNNRVAAISAASIAVMTGFAAWRMRWPEARSESRAGTTPGEIESVPLDPRLIWITALACAALVAIYAWLVFLAHMFYPGDAGYFMGQMSAAADYHRTLYTGLEFSYGPLLFYPPIWLRALLSPMHVSLAGAYFAVLVVEQMAGVWMVAYVLDNLPIARKLKTVLFLVYAVQMLQPTLGLNYTFFRFAMPFATLLFIAKRRRPWAVAGLMAAGEVLNLAISPEMGLAFGAGAVAFGLYRLCTSGRSAPSRRSWIPALAAPFAGAAVFLCIAGTGYLRMFALFSRGVGNFIVEPQPHILIFLFALVWLVPIMLAGFFRSQRPEAPVLAALFVISLGLLPAAFGRADPTHVVFSGFGIFLLSMVAISSYRHVQQLAWTGVVVAVLLWTQGIDLKISQSEVRLMIHYDVLHYGSPGMKSFAMGVTRRISPSAAARYMTATFPDDQPFDLAKLWATVGDAQVATPYEVSLQVEDALKRSGKYRPGFYWYYVAILDATAETREIDDFNQSRWALIPAGAKVLEETPARLGELTGIALPYRSKRKPYVAGERFYENLQAHWQPVSVVSGYTVYRRNDP